MDDATRRQLRFSVFLQAAGAVMFAIALVARIASVGVDAWTVAFAAGLALTVTAAIAIGRRLRTR